MLSLYDQAGDCFVSKPVPAPAGPVVSGIQSNADSYIRIVIGGIIQIISFEHEKAAPCTASVRTVHYLPAAHIAFRVKSYQPDIVLDQGHGISCGHRQGGSLIN